MLLNAEERKSPTKKQENSLEEKSNRRQNAKEWAGNGKAKAGNAEEERKRPKKKQENSIEEVKCCTQTKKDELQKSNRRQNAEE
ncbi:hypothetical protein T08_12276 [Trichinella sp. T8]|nr:hypothetical protein T08_12276 [Trichinella sp. T8]